MCVRVNVSCRQKKTVRTMIRGNVDVSQRDEHARTAKRGFVFIVTRGFQSRSAALHGSTLFRKLLELKLTQRG